MMCSLFLRTRKKKTGRGMFDRVVAGYGRTLGWALRHGVLVMLILGTILVVSAFYVDVHFEPPLWVHAIIWPVVGLPLALLIMRPLKALFVALQLRHNTPDI